jgi:hypothetical protein
MEQNQEEAKRIKEDAVTQVRKEIGKEVVRKVASKPIRYGLAETAKELGLHARRISCHGWAISGRNGRYLGIVSWRPRTACYKAISYLLNGLTYGSAYGLLRLLTQLTPKEKPL